MPFWPHRLVVINSKLVGFRLKFFFLLAGDFIVTNIRHWDFALQLTALIGRMSATAELLSFSIGAPTVAMILN
jgi:hypothetical protein